MAKKRVPASQNATPVSLAQAIREALAELGLDATVSDVADWLSAKYPQVTFNRVTMVSSLAMHRQKQRRTAWEGWASSGDSPSVEEVKRVKQMADERGGLEKVASMIQQIDEMAMAAGGFDKLKAAVA